MLNDFTKQIQLQVKPLNFIVHFNYFTLLKCVKGVSRGKIKHLQNTLPFKVEL